MLQHHYILAKIGLTQPRTSPPKFVARALHLTATMPSSSQVTISGIGLWLLRYYRERTERMHSFSFDPPVCVCVCVKFWKVTQLYRSQSVQVSNHFAAIVKIRFYNNDTFLHCSKICSVSYHFASALSIIILRIWICKNSQNSNSDYSIEIGNFSSGFCRDLGKFKTIAVSQCILQEVPKFSENSKAFF